MKQNIFEIRQQAEQLLREATAIWRQSSHADQLEDIENDPVFSLLVTALAYQLNDVDSDIDRLRQDVLDEYARSTVSSDLGTALPATAVVQTGLQPGFQPVDLDEHAVFTLNGTPYTFVPLLATTVYGVEADTLVRLDARRWKMTLHFSTPVTDIGGLSFAVRGGAFKTLRVTLGGKTVPMVCPWNYADLPLCRCFAPDGILYGSGRCYNAPSVWFDLFARQNVRIFSVRRHAPATLIPVETDKIDLVLEFSGTATDFAVDKEAFAFNPIVLVNATPRTADLSSDAPVVRVGGYGSSGNAPDQFLHLARPSDDQMYASATVDVRTVSADRFNQATLLQTVGSLLNKLDTDYYAFLDLKEKYREGTIHQLRTLLRRLQQACTEQPAVSSITPGTYLMLRQSELEADRDISLQVNYLTTSGSGPNAHLTPKSIFSVPAGLTVGEGQQIADPVAGRDTITDRQTLAAQAHYGMVTHDRIVTPADMRMFCFSELMARYSISSDMIRSVTVRHSLQDGRDNAGYEIWVDILIEGTPFVQRYFAERIPQAELFLQKMIETRSATLYPILVNIRIEEQ